jgi:hypothetical protein
VKENWMLIIVVLHQFFNVIASTTTIKKSTTRDVPQQWVLLAKLKEF